MYGMAINPTMMSPGKTTPANQGSKYTSISCNPRKYQGALDGFGELDGFAGSSRGACSAIDQPIKTTVRTTMQINSVYTRSGHVSTLSAVSSCSTSGLPSAIRLSFLTASRNANQVKNGTRKSMPTIGTLSAFVTINRKFVSSTLIPMKPNMHANTIAHDLLG